MSVVVVQYYCVYTLFLSTELFVLTRQYKAVACLNIQKQSLVFDCDLSKITSCPSILWTAVHHNYQQVATIVEHIDCPKQ